jgi:hypothetical protein
VHRGLRGGAPTIRKGFFRQPPLRPVIGHAAGDDGSVPRIVTAGAGVGFDPRAISRRLSGP